MEFWRAFKYRIFDGKEEITTDDVTGATVHLRFPSVAFTSDTATIDITPREGHPVSVGFDLSSLR